MKLKQSLRLFNISNFLFKKKFQIKHHFSTFYNYYPPISLFIYFFLYFLLRLLIIFYLFLFILFHFSFIFFLCCFALLCFCCGMHCVGVDYYCYCRGLVATVRCSNQQLAATVVQPNGQPTTIGAAIRQLFGLSFSLSRLHCFFNR